FRAPSSPSESRSSPPYTSALWLPSVHVADQRTSPGVSENFGTMPGPMYSPKPASSCFRSMSLAWNFGSPEVFADAVARPADPACIVEHLVDLGGVALGRPVGDDPVELLLVLGAREV